MNRFQKLALTTTATTFFLIVVGAFVRAAGAGMGCPDWPRCFGRFIPPTQLSEVPPQFAEYFNVRLAWIEYLNRLLGVSTGLLITATLYLAWRTHRDRPRVLWATTGAFLGVGLAGWLGKKVVNRHLHPSMVTIHLLVALLTAGLLVYATVVCFDRPEEEGAELPEERRRYASLTVATLGVALLQVALGTRVRAALEGIARSMPELSRGAWLAEAGGVDLGHRVLAVLTVLCVGALWWLARSWKLGARVERVSGLAAGVVLAQLAAGLGLAYLALPPALQVLHVALGSLLVFALEVLALVALRPAPAPSAAPVEPALSNAVAG